MSSDTVSTGTSFGFDECENGLVDVLLGSSLSSSLVTGCFALVLTTMHAKCCFSSGKVVDGIASNMVVCFESVVMTVDEVVGDEDCKD